MQITDNSVSAIFYNDIYTGLTNVPSTRATVRGQLATAFWFHNNVSIDFKAAYLHPKSFVYFGTGGSTTTSANIAYNGIVQMGNDWVVDSTVTVTKGDGDQTVPADSASPAPVSVQPVERRGFPSIEHKALSSEAVVIGAVRDKIVSLF